MAAAKLKTLSTRVSEHVLIELKVRAAREQSTTQKLVDRALARFLNIPIKEQTNRGVSRNAG
ncbi:MAG: hypothetical protein ACLQU2_03365 [Candidatus Binataceae bacterium]